jgi:hypothetical protein
MKRHHLLSVLTVGLALTTARGAFAAATGVLNPTPNRESKLVVDFENTITATADPNGAGENRASANTDTQFAAEGTKSLKVDLTDVPSGGWADPAVVITLPQPVDIKGYGAMSMDVYAPPESMNPDSTDTGWYQIYPRLTVTNAGDDTQTTVISLPFRQLKNEGGWNHLEWDLKTGSDTKITQIALATGTNGSRPFTGPIYLDNVRVYKGTFVGLQPDEKLIAGFDAAADKDLFTVGDATGVAANTDKQFISQGEGSLAVDLTGQGGGWTNNVVRADDLGANVDVSNATAIHLDLYVPSGSIPDGAWQQIGFAVVGENGTMEGFSQEFLTDQWNTYEIALTPDQATMLGHVKGIYLLRNQGGDWRGPVYIDDLRAVVPTTNGGTTAGP